MGLYDFGSVWGLCGLGIRKMWECLNNWGKWPVHREAFSNLVTWIAVFFGVCLIIVVFNPLGPAARQNVYEPNLGN